MTQMPEAAELARAAMTIPNNVKSAQDKIVMMEIPILILIHVLMTERMTEVVQEMSAI